MNNAWLVLFQDSQFLSPQDAEQRRKERKAAAAATAAKASKDQGGVSTGEETDVEEQTGADELAELEKQAHEDDRHREGQPPPQADDQAVAAEAAETPRPEPLFSYSILTTTAPDDLAWLHDRQPAVLPTPEAIDSWLNVKDVPMDEVGGYFFRGG